MGDASGPRNANWKGGRTVTQHGYVLIKMPEHHRADCRGYVYEHVLVAEKDIGRMIDPGEEVHHKNKLRSDNRPENLEVAPDRAGHSRFHRKAGSKYAREALDENELIECPCGCGQWLERFDGHGRIRTMVTGHNAAHGKDGRWEART